MPKSLTILSDHSEYLEFQELREAGLRHLGNLSGQIWTDHNLHDPGITILEMLCYALTDLGYRTSFDIQDLIARKETGKLEDNFFTAAEILGCNPLTPLDYRKLLIDIDGVRNAWLEPVYSARVAISDQTTGDPVLILIADLIDGTLKTIPEDNFDERYHRKIVINGLYRVYLELEHFRPTVTQDSGQAALNRESILQQVRQVLLEHRNFSEDFLDVVILEDEKIGICADLELTPDADPNAVLQELYAKVQEFISPSVRFYTLSEMLDRKKRPEEIFEGRPLRPSSHGFIDTNQLEAIERRDAIYISDLYQEILKIPHIRAIRSLHLSTFWAANGSADSDQMQQQCADASWNQSGTSPDNSTAKQSGKEWVLPLSPASHRPVLSPAHSSIVFYKGPIPLYADDRRAKDVFENRLANFKKTLLEEQELDWAILNGEFSELDDYLSIQHEFPLVYGIGVGGLSQTAPAKRTAQALQLQAFLTFFDQLLANYLAQLANIRKLFSFRPEPDLHRSNFFQALKDTPKGEKLIRFFKTEPGSEALPLPDPDLPYLKDEVIAVAAETYSSPEDREELIFKTVRAFEERSTRFSIYPEATNGSRPKYRFLISNKANDKLLLSAREFLDEQSALKEAKALLLMRIQADHFRRIDEDVQQESGDYEHVHSFKLGFRPDDYLAMFDTITESEEVFFERRNSFLDHMLGRFSEKFTDYVLLMYALDGDRRDENEIVKDKERFLQFYPLISRKRGRGFDYTDLRLTKICEPEQFIFDPTKSDKILFPDLPKSDGDYRFQLVDVDSGGALFISRHKNYSLKTAEPAVRDILRNLAIDPAEAPRYRVHYPADPGACIQIVRDLTVRLKEETPPAPTDQNTTPIPKKLEIQEVLAVTPFDLEDLPKIMREADLSTAKKKLSDLFMSGKIAYQLKQADNTSGLERRVAALMGVDDWQRTSLSFLSVGTERKKRFGFQVTDTQTNLVLFQSSHQNKRKRAARQFGRTMLNRLATAWDNPYYRVRLMPGEDDNQSPEYIYRIDVIKIPDPELPPADGIKDFSNLPEVVAIHPETFGTRDAANARLQLIKDAIENGKGRSKVLEAELIPYFELKNESGDTILTGLISLEKVDQIKALAENFSNDTNDQIKEKDRLLQEELNNFLRLLGSGQSEYMFFVDPFQEESYDFQVVHRDYRVARHPHIFQHKLMREKARDGLLAYAENTNWKDLFTEFSFRAKELANAPQDKRFKFQIIDGNAPSGEHKELWQSEHRFPDEACARLFYDYYFMDIVEAAREYGNYKIELNNGGYRILLGLPPNLQGETISLRYPFSLSSEESAIRKADYLRQRARLFPILRQDNSYVFFLYKNSPAPSYGTNAAQEKLREKWNFNWEDYILWQGLRRYASLENALLNFRGEPTVPDPCAASFEGLSFLDLIGTSRNYERMETDDEKGRKDDIGPFNLEIVNPGKILAVTPPAYRIVQDRKNAFNEMEAHLFREGFHIVEHILLRPSVAPTGYPFGFEEKDIDEVNNLLEQCDICPNVDPSDLPLRNDEYLPLIDPFSQWATVVLPFWPKRFQNINFRKFFEETLRREAPAHVALRVAWIDPIQMADFEDRYKKWLKALATRDPDILEYRNRLLEKVLDLENVYPDTNLSDTSAGDSSEGGVVLDFSKLI